MSNFGRGNTGASAGAAGVAGGWALVMAPVVGAVVVVGEVEVEVGWDGEVGLGLGFWSASAAAAVVVGEVVVVGAAAAAAAVVGAVGEEEEGADVEKNDVMLFCFCFLLVVEVGRAPGNLRLRGADIFGVVGDFFFLSFLLSFLLSCFRFLWLSA